MVKDHRDNEKKPAATTLLVSRYSFWLTAKYFYMHYPTNSIAHIIASFIHVPVVEHRLEREIYIYFIKYFKTGVANELNDCQRQIVFF